MAETALPIDAREAAIEQRRQLLEFLTGKRRPASFEAVLLLRLELGALCTER